MDKFHFSDASWQVSPLAIPVMSACNKVHHEEFLIYYNYVFIIDVYEVWLYCGSEHMLKSPWSHVSAMQVPLSCQQFRLQLLCATSSCDYWLHCLAVAFQLLWMAATQHVCPFVACHMLSVHMQQVSTSVGAVGQTCCVMRRWSG